MAHPGLALGQQGHFARVHVDGMRHDRARPQDAVFLQPVDDPLSGFSEAIELVGLVFRNVDVKTNILRCSRAAGLRPASR